MKPLKQALIEFYEGRVSVIEYGLFAILIAAVIIAITLLGDSLASYLLQGGG